MAEREEPIDPVVIGVAKDLGQSSTANHAPDSWSTMSDSDDIVELRAPKRRKTKKRTTKKLQLLLNHASSSEFESHGLMPNKSILQPPPHPMATEVFEPKEEDSCTPDNWTSFFSHTKQDKLGVHSACSSKEFEQKRGIASWTNLSLIKFSDYQIGVQIGSPYLQKQLRKLVEIEHYAGVFLTTSGIRLTGDFLPLYHHIDDMRSNVASDNEATSADRAHMDALYYFSTLGWPAKSYGEARNHISQGFIMHRELWALFKPGDFAVLTDELGHATIRKISTVELEYQHESDKKQHSWLITLLNIVWTGSQFKKTWDKRSIQQFTGTKRITGLEFYPLSHHELGDELRETAIQRGKAWKQYCEGEPRVMSYQGQALPMLVEESREDGDNRMHKPFNLLSTVIVDSGSTSKAAMQANIDNKQCVYCSDYYDKDPDVSSFTDEEFMICPSILEVFSLDNHVWYLVETNGLKPKVWRPESFDRLVLSQDKKDTLIRLAKTNSRLVQGNKSNDIIEGKGKGTVLLLHGPPGVGKTLTAEVLSEYTGRPLLKVNLGRVATHKKWEESLEQIFSNAEAWKAILLIDEAEIVLEKRTFERMTQNSWISVFLRKLEYYKGILILTTNLIHCIDEAFESRISYPLRFQELNRDDRHQIWSDFIEGMTMLPAHKKTLMDEVDRWSEAEINGRQIRNVILMAENLAVSDEKHPRLTPKHIDELLNVTIEFCEYNQNSLARAKKIQLGGPSY